MDLQVAKNPARTVGGQLVRRQSEPDVSRQKRSVRKELDRGASLPFYWKPIAVYICALAVSISTNDKLHIPAGLSELKANEFFLIYFGAFWFAFSKFMESMLALVFHKSSTTIAIICLIQYTAGVLDILPAAIVGGYGSVGNDRMIIRYLTWSFTSPLMTQWLLDVIPAAPETTSACRKAQTGLVLMNLMGFVAVYVSSQPLALCFFGLSCLCFLAWASFARPLFLALGKHTLTGPEDAMNMYKGTVALWHSFPVVWALGFFGVLGPVATECGIVMSDLGVKVIFSSMMFNQLANLRGMNDEMDAALARAEKQAEAKIGNLRGFVKAVLSNLRAPVNCIVEGMEGINREVVKSKTQESGELTLDLVSSSAAQAASMIEMTLLQLRKSDFSMDKKSTNLLSLVSQCMENMSIWATQRNIVISLVPGKDTIPRVMASYDVLWRALLNFLSNAIKFSSADTTVTITLKILNSLSEAKTSVDTKLLYGLGKEMGDPQTLVPEDRAVVFISVHDDGTGIAATNMNTLFEISSHGKGLSTTAEDIKSEGGVIGVKTLPKVGSEFYMAIPFKVSDGASTPSEQSSICGEDSEASHMPKIEEVDTSTLNILVVDDFSANRKLLKGLLVRKGFNVEEADDGTTCLEMVEKMGKSYYSAILMDGSMPKMGGRECTLKLRADGYMCPVYGVSGFAAEDDVESFNNAGATRMMAKPANINELCSWLSLDLGIKIASKKPKAAPKAGMKRRKPKAKVESKEKTELEESL